MLNALIDWRRRMGPGFPVGEDPQLSRLMADRADRALAVAAGIAVKVNSQSPTLAPGTLARLTINISNAGNRTVQIKKLTLAGWGEVLTLDPAEQLSADTETITPVDSVTPPTAAVTVPPAEHLYDDLLFGHRFVAKTELEIDGARFSVKGEKSFDVVPAVEITNVSPSPCVRTEATLGRCDNFRVTLTNHSAKPFAGLLSLTTRSGQHEREVSHQLQLAPLETRTANFSNHDSRPSREILGAAAASVVVSIRSDQKRPAFDRTNSLTERTVTVTYADARVSKVSELATYQVSIKHSHKHSMLSEHPPIN